MSSRFSRPASGRVIRYLPVSAVERLSSSSSKVPAPGVVLKLSCPERSVRCSAQSTALDRNENQSRHRSEIRVSHPGPRA